jgi:hypothetical protein
MARYKIWDKQETIYTPVPDKETKKGVFTPEEWIERWPFAGIPGVKVVVAGGAINGGFCGEFGEMKETYQKAGADITDGMTDEEVLAAIEAFEDNPPGAGEPSTEERTAAALEFIAMNGMEDVEQ